MSPVAGRWAWAAIDLDAVRHNVALLGRVVAPADLWAVVKADGYGHGAAEVAAAAIDAGAAGLCVALVEEGERLRQAGIAAPILVLSQQPSEQLDRLVGAGLQPTVYRPEAVDALQRAAERVGVTSVEVHVKVDTGMQRVGVSPEGVAEVVDAVLAAAPVLRLAAISTHLAVADQPDHPMNGVQLERFDDAVATVSGRLVTAGVDPEDLRLHVANSAAALALPAAHRSFVRAGIAVYGISPGHGVDDLAGELRPALRLVARVSHVKRVAAGTGISYGLRHVFTADTTVATVPIGYADGVPRRLAQTGGEVLIGGRRCPIVGVVTMDQLMVDVGEAEVRVGDEVVLLGRQGAEEVRAEEWADRLDTIGYEIVCGIGPRIGRIRVPDEGSAASSAGTAGT